tara:strand:- start:2622 stop:3002 length:381 start_codon:yes stop_codon:yes gene_type:complete
MLVDLRTKLNKSQIILVDFFVYFKENNINYNVYYNDEFNIKAVIDWYFYIYTEGRSEIKEYGAEVSAVSMLLEYTLKDNKEERIIESKYYEVQLNAPTLEKGAHGLKVKNIVVNFANKIIFVNLKN